MTIDIDRDLNELRRLTTGQLQQRYADLFGEPVHTGNKAWLIKRLAWRMQALAEGGLSERARQRAAELARDEDLRLSPPRRPYSPRKAEDSSGSACPAAIAGQAPSPRHDDRLPPAGSVLTRAYKGQTHEVTVLVHGFEYGGEKFLSLSAVANKITGTHCNGFWFFRLGRYAKGGQS